MTKRVLTLKEAFANHGDFCDREADKVIQLSHDVQVYTNGSDEVFLEFGNGTTLRIGRDSDDISITGAKELLHWDGFKLVVK